MCIDERPLDVSAQLVSNPAAYGTLRTISHYSAVLIKVDDVVDTVYRHLIMLF